MAGQGIKITDLRPEVQTLVNSDPKKYDPNANGKIDDGVELSQLLSEYQCKAEDLTAADKKEPMWTSDELVTINRMVKQRNDDGPEVIGAIGTIIGTIASGRIAEGLFNASPKKIFFVKAAAAVTGILATIAGAKAHTNSIKEQVKVEIKAEQAQKGTATMQERLKQEAEMREREAALKKDELEYRERMNDATQGVDKKLKSAERRANNINKNLKEAESKTTAKKDSVA